MSLNAKALGISGGLVLGIYIMGFTILSILTGYGADFLSHWEPLHVGYSITWMGSLVGFAYGFVEGFVWLFIFAHIYNYLLGKMK